MSSQAAPSWVAHLGLRLRSLVVPEDREQLSPKSSSKCLEALTGPARVTRPLRTSPGGQSVDCADNLAHRSSIEPDGVRVPAPRTSGAEGYLEHALSTERHHRQGVKT